MSDWIPTPPPPTDLGDREVATEGCHLSGKRIALLVTGGIAAMKAPLLARALRRQGAVVTAFLSAEGARYVAPDALSWSCDRAVVTDLSPRAEHLSDESRFDAYLVAPATYNTINKMAAGIADGLVTATLASALGRMERGQCSVIVAPTMHGSMHTQILSRNLAQLQAWGVCVVPPREDHGKHNLPDEGALVAAVCCSMSTSALTGVPILVTGGPIPSMLDDVRQLSNPFSGALAVEITKELTLRGAAVRLILGNGSAAVPAWIPFSRARDIEQYREMVIKTLDLPAAERPRAALLSAGVADFAPVEKRPGKVASDGVWDVRLAPTGKIIDDVARATPRLHLVGFKYTRGVTLQASLAIGKSRLCTSGSVPSPAAWDAAVVNRGEDISDTSHEAWFLTPSTEPVSLHGKPAIAIALADHLELHASVSRDQAAPSVQRRGA